MSSPSEALHELQAHNQWVNFIFASRGKKITKPPINPNIPANRPYKERLADTTDPATWADYETAITRWKASSAIYKGIGFVFTARDSFCGIDLDHCRDKSSGNITSWAQRLLQLLNSYSEISINGEGIHIYIKASLITTLDTLGFTEVSHRQGNIEIYDTERYFTWTGNHIAGTPTTIRGRQDELTTLYQEIFHKEEKHEERAHITQVYVPCTLDDTCILKQARLARGGNGQKFARLWAGNASDYSRPDGSIDQSRADQALLGILAYWTQRNASQMERLFKGSGLYRWDRWDRPARSGETYGQGSIRLAIANCRQVYDPTWRPPRWADSNGSRPGKVAPQAHDDEVRKPPFPHYTPLSAERRAYP